MSLGFSFGSSAPSTQATGFSFGTSAASTTPASSTGFSFGTSALKPAGSSFSLNPAPSTAPAGTTGFSFGAPAATQAATGFSFGTPAAAPQASAGFSFGAPAAATQASTGFSFGVPAATTQASTGLGLGATSAAPTFPLGAFGATSTAPATSTPFVGLGGKVQLGLGGAASSAGGLAAAADFGKADGKPAKEAAVPDVVVQTVEAFKKHVKEQKSECELISRHSWAPVQRVGEETAALAQLLAAVEASVQHHAAVAAKLKHDVREALKSAEVAQRTSEISAGLQYENTAPQELFERLVQQYEASMVTYRRQIDQLERLLAASDGAGAVSPQELMRAIRQLHETFVWLAGHLQTVHEKVQALKDHYLAYRRTVGGEVGDVFGGGRARAGPPPPPPLPEPRVGPSPFAVDRNAAAAAVAQALGQALPPLPAAGAMAAPAAAGGLLGSGLFGSSTGGFGAASSPFAATSSAGLKLDPPPGSKRGKVN